MPTWSLAGVSKTINIKNAKLRFYNGQKIKSYNFYLALNRLT